MAIHTNKNAVTGSMEDYSGGTLPYGRLLCYGQTLNAATNTQYQKLYNIIGNAFGGTNNTNFQLPDSRGRVHAGVDNMGGTAANRLTSGGSGITGTTLGANGGSETHILLAAESGLPAHSGTGLATTIIDSGLGSHTHSPPAGGGFLTTASGPNVYNAGFGPATIEVDTGPPASILHSHDVSVSVSAADASSAHQNTQPTIIVTKMIVYV